MQKSSFSDERGVGHLGLILAVVVVLAFGGVGYFVYSKNKKSDDTNTGAYAKTLEQAIKNAKCDYDDKDLCKFFTGYKIQKYYTVVSTNESDGKKTTMILKSEGSDKSHLKMAGSTQYEVITIGKTTYTKAANGTWWKQTLENNAASNLENEATTNFTEPENTHETNKISYKKIGKEACDDGLTCFKYQEIDPSDTKTTTYLWFDDRDYQLRHSSSEGSGSKSDSTYNYDKVSITEPTPVKELGPNQVLLPGQNEPTTLPSSSGSDSLTPQEIQQMMPQ